MTRLILLLVIAWANITHAEEESLVPKSTRQKMFDSYGSVLDNKWFKSFKSEEGDKTTTADIKKSHLWHAALDVIGFMPIIVSDASGGVISTDWHKDTKDPDEMFKVNIIIKSSELTAKSLQVTVFRKTLIGNEWHNSPSSDTVAINMAASIKQQILQKAKKLNS